MDSILESIRNIRVGSIDETSFDSELILYTNMAFAILYDLKVGNKDSPFVISDSTQKWSDIDTDNDMSLIKSFVNFKVQLMFDPPTSSYVLNAIQNELNQIEWRLRKDSELKEE